MAISSGTYTITSDIYQRVVKLTANTLNRPLTLVDATGDDSESWIVHAFADGTITIKNKKYRDSDNPFITASISAGSKVTDGDGTHWKYDGSAVAISGLAWEATVSNHVVLQARDGNSSHQSFTFVPA